MPGIKAFAALFFCSKIANKICETAADFFLAAARK
jgi:hypothetical protein